MSYAIIIIIVVDLIFLFVCLMYFVVNVGLLSNTSSLLGTPLREPPQRKKNKHLTPGELTLDELPPIQDLNISLSQEKTKLLGRVLNVVVQMGESRSGARVRGVGERQE